MAMGMGNQVAALFVALGADVSEFEQKMDRAGAKVRKAGKGFTDAGLMLTKAITVPMTLLAGLSLRASVQFESAFAGVRKTVDATEAEFAQFRRQILDMNATLPASAKEIAGVAEAAGQLGIQNEALMDFTRTMIDLGETTDMASQDAAKALARVANIMGTNQGQFRNLGSAIVALGNNLATTESEIVTMTLRLAGAGKQVGLTEAETLGFAAALSSVGIMADAGGTAFSKVFIEISKAVSGGADAVREFSNVAGMSAEDFSKAFQDDAAGAIISFVEGLGKVEERGGNLFNVLDKLGIQERRMVDALLRTANAGDIVRKSIDMSSVAMEENTALTAEAGMRYETTAAQIEMAKGQAFNTAVAIGDNLKGAFEAMLVPMAGFLKRLEDTAIAFQKLPMPIRGTAGGLLALAAGIPVLMVALGMLAKSFVAIREAAILMSITTKRALVSTGIGAAIIAFGALALYVMDNWNDVGPFFSKFWNELVLNAAIQVQKFLAVVRSLTSWIPGAEIAIIAAQSKLSKLIDERVQRRQVLEHEENQRKIQKASEDAAQAAEDARMKATMAALESGEIFGDLGDDADEAAERAKNVAAIWENLGKDLGEVGIRAEILGNRFEMNKEAAGVMTEALVQLRLNGVDPLSQSYQDLQQRIREALMDNAGGFSKVKIGSEMDTGEIDAAISDLPAQANLDLDKFRTVLTDAEKDAMRFRQSVAQEVTGGMHEAATGFLEGVGAMAAGQGTLSGVVAGVLGTLADMAIRVGKIAVATGFAIEGIQTALKSLNPAAAIVAGAALIILGSAVKAKLAAAASGGGGGGGSVSMPQVTAIGNYGPSLPGTGSVRQNNTDASDDRGSGRRDSDGAGKTKVSIFPEVLPSGDINYSLREGNRRANRYGTEVI